MKKVTIVLMMSLLLMISTVGCHRVEEIRGTVDDIISKSVSAPKLTSAPVPAEQSSTATPSAPEVTPVKQDTSQPSLPPHMPKPDLIIQDMTWRPLNQMPGENITFTVTVKNQGDADVTASRVHYYVDGAQKGASNVFSIPAGETVLKTFVWKVEQLAYAVRAIVDYNDNVPESNETNNDKKIIFSGALIPAPDLIVQDITWSPLNPSPGDTVTFTIIVENQGNGNAADPEVYYYVDGVRKGSTTISLIPAGTTSEVTFTWKSETGQHTIYAVVDYQDNIPESDETNNDKEIASSDIYLADLVIQNITWSPQSPSLWDTVTFFFTVKNSGDGAAGTSSLYYYIGEYAKGAVPVASIPPGGTASGNFTWSAAVGKSTIAAVADYYNAVPEDDENNNMKQVTIPQPTIADLIIQDITWSPLAPSTGDTVTFTVTVKNQGSGTAVASTLYYYIDDNRKGSVAISSISAGGTATGTFTWNAVAGEHIIKAVADYHDDVAERDNSNNSGEITFSGALPIDLIIQDITWSPLNPFPGDNVTFAVTIKNQGDGEAGAFQVNYYVDGFKKDFNTISSITAGGTATETFTWNAEKGEHIIKVMVDYNNDISESDETNNEEEMTFTGTHIPRPDLIIQDIYWFPLNPSVWDTVTFTVIVKNQGSGSASPFWVYYYIDGLSQNPGRLFTIPAGSTMSGTLTWRAVPGTHTIKAVANQYHQLTESDTTNNDKVVTFVVN